MPDYRVYFLDPDTGQIRTAENFAASDDEAAAERARQRDASGPLELWCGGRKVAELEAVPEGEMYEARCR